MSVIIKNISADLKLSLQALYKTAKERNNFPLLLHKLSEFFYADRRFNCNLQTVYQCAKALAHLLLQMAPSVTVIQEQ